MAKKRSKRRPVAGSMLLLLAALAVLYTSVSFVPEPAWSSVERVTARSTAHALSVLGVEAKARGVYVVSPVFAFHVIRECTAVFPIVIFLSALVATPGTLHHKAWGAAAGTAALFLVNQVRLVSLFYVGRFFPTAFETVHSLVWQSLMILACLLAWLAWLSITVRERTNGGRH